jgi:FkbM family methyltransferase
MLLLRLIFKELYYILKSKEGRVFAWLAFRYGNRARYRALKTKVMGYRLNVPDALSFIWQFREIFMEDSYRFSTDHPQPVVYDCGGNLGLSCLYFKKLYPNSRLKVFEADEKIAAVLRDNLKNNGIQNVEIIAKAVWKDDNGIELALEGADGASIFGTHQKTRIESLRLKDMLAQELYIDMLKMDIEGGEWDVLLDCADELHKVKHIFVEYHAYQGHPQRLSDILQLLESKGFRYFIYNPVSRRSPLINRNYAHSLMDLQLNIHAYYTLDGEG